MPRPDVKAIGVEYRRIPLMSIGRDIYCDTRIILTKLDELFPASAAHPSISASTLEDKAIEKLLGFWITDGGIFPRASQLIPTSLPLMQDPKFKKDRAEMTGRNNSTEVIEALRPEALMEIKGALKVLEEILLADGREWILKSKGPSLADIEGMDHSSLLQPSLVFIHFPLSLIDSAHSCMAILLAQGPKGRTSSGPDLGATVPKDLCVDRPLRAGRLSSRQSSRKAEDS
jgi:glutathione S-transferase